MKWTEWVSMIFLKKRENILLLNVVAAFSPSNKIEILINNQKLYYFLMYYYSISYVFESQFV